MAIPLLSAPVFLTIISFIVGGIITRFLLALGFGIIIFIGIDDLMDWVIAAVDQALSDVAVITDLYQILLLAGVPQAIRLVLSAMVAIISFKIAVGLFRRLIPFRSLD